MNLRVFVSSLLQAFALFLIGKISHHGIEPRCPATQFWGDSAPTEVRTRTTESCFEVERLQDEDSGGHQGLQTELQSALDQIVKRENLPGITLGIVLPDQTILQLSAGLQDQENKLPMPREGRMLVGSVGKTYVAAVVLQLVSEGQIGLDDLAEKYFAQRADGEWFTRLPNSDAITIRSLLNHTSGLPRYIFTEGFLQAVKADRFRKWTPVEQLSFIFDQPPVHPVGQGWAYSDTNYLVLGLIVEQVTGNRFYDEAHRRLLEPLKLSRTEPSDRRDLSGLVPGYIGDTNFFSLPAKTVVDGKYVMDPSFEWCGGGFISNSGDLARWAFVLHASRKHSVGSEHAGESAKRENNADSEKVGVFSHLERRPMRLLTAELHQQLVQPVSFRTGQPAESGYGLGCFVWDTKHGKFWGHAGIMPGYLTQVEFSPDHNFAIALQVNSDQGLGQNLHGVCQELASLVVRYLTAKQNDPSSK